jgi:hypothetical protein
LEVALPPPLTYLKQIHAISDPCIVKEAKMSPKLAMEIASKKEKEGLQVFPITISKTVKMSAGGGYIEPIFRVYFG